MHFKKSYVYSHVFFPEFLLHHHDNCLNLNLKFCHMLGGRAGRQDAHPAIIAARRLYEEVAPSLLPVLAVYVARDSHFGR